MPSHDRVLRELRALARAADRSAIAGAFVASLGQPPGFWRAPLCALAGALAVPSHRYRAFSAATPDCAECGLVPEVEPDEVDERGQLLPGDLAGAWLVLSRARDEQPPQPSKADARRLERVLGLVRALPATAREGKLADAIRTAKLITGNRTDVRCVIETLGACGILQTPEHPGFTTRWTSFAARQDRPSSRVECDPPIAFWTAAHGVDAGNTKTWFGALGVSVSAGTGPRAVAVAAASKRAAARDKRAGRVTELLVGDVVAVPRGKKWFAAVVVDHQRDKGGCYPVLQPLEWRGTQPPTLDDVRGRRAAGSVHGMFHREALDMWTRDDKQGRWRTVAEGVPKPATAHLQPPIGTGVCFGSVGKTGEGFARLFAGAAGSRR